MISWEIGECLRGIGIVGQQRPAIRAKKSEPGDVEMAPRRQESPEERTATDAASITTLAFEPADAEKTVKDDKSEA